MQYNTIEDGESTPLHEGGYSKEPLSTNKRTSSIIVRAMMVGTAMAMGALLLMAGPSKIMTMHQSNNVDGMVVVSSTTSPRSEIEACYVAVGNLMDWVVKTARGGVRDPGKRGRNGVIGSSLKPAMCRTIDHPTIAVGPTLIPTKKNMLHCLNAVIPRATMTATRTTTKMGCGMCRHPSRMVPVACRASTLKRSRQGLVFVFKDAFFLRFSIPNTRRHTQNKYYK